MKAADLSKDELKALIGEIVEQKLREFLDPDHGLELREDFVQAIETSASSKERIPFADIKKKLGMS